MALVAGLVLLEDLGTAALIGAVAVILLLAAGARWAHVFALAPIAGAVGFAATRLNHLQFLTIRRYLSLVFMALVALLLVLAIWT